MPSRSVDASLFSDENEKVSLKERIFKGVQVCPNTGCWDWTGYKSPKGYARISFKRANCFAHRVSYLAHKGQIIDGLEIDHVCRNRGCVNPDHLETVTRSENMKRSWAVRPRKTHCDAGHEISGRNLRIVNKATAVCRICHNARARFYQRGNR